MLNIVCCFCSAFPGHWCSGESTRRCPRRQLAKCGPTTARWQSELDTVEKAHGHGRVLLTTTKSQSNEKGTQKQRGKRTRARKRRKKHDSETRPTLLRIASHLISLALHFGAFRATPHTAMWDHSSTSLVSSPPPHRRSTPTNPAAAAAPTQSCSVPRHDHLQLFALDRISPQAANSPPKDLHSNLRTSRRVDNFHHSS